MVNASPLPSRQLPQWELSISLVRSTVPVPPNAQRLADVAGGPNELLVWLESQLGLHAPADVPLRLAALNAAAFASMSGPGSSLAIARSYKDHPYAVVRRLLEHRDSFLMATPLAGSSTATAIDTCGLEVATQANLPELVREYAALMGTADPEQRDAIATGEPDRLAKVHEALVDGQRLPPCRITVWDDPHAWPGRWRSLFQFLKSEQPHCVVDWLQHLPAPAAPADSALHTVQTAIDPGYHCPDVPRIAEDHSLRAVRCSSVTTAGHAVAAALAGLSVEELSAAVIVCEDDSTAALIDGHLHALGRPTMGAAVRSQASEIHALLPLAMEATAMPPDPRRIKELLSLAASPIPWSARKALLRAMDDFAAVGSPAWRDALDALAAKLPDGPADVAEVHTWIPVPAVHGTAMVGFDHAAAVEAVRRLAQWANQRAQGVQSGIEKELGEGLPNAEQNARQEFASARRSHYQSLHAVCRALERLLLSRAGAHPISRTEFLQLLDTVGQSLPGVALHPETAGGPLRLRSFADIDPRAAGLHRVIWVGTTTTPLTRSPWAAYEIEETLRSHGIDLDALSRELGARRHAERAGLRRIAGSLLVVAYPSQDPQSRPHPFWVTILEMLRAHSDPSRGSAYELKLLDSASEPFPLAPWVIDRTSTAPEPTIPPLDAIQLPPGVHLPLRDTVSQTDVLKRLTCPVAWTLDYGCRIRARTTAGLKNGSALAGSAAERVMRELFERNPPVNTAAALVELERLLRDRLPFIHAGLCQPTALVQRRAFEDMMRRAVPAMQCLFDGGVRVHFGAEIGAFKDALGKPLSWNGASPDGAIDVLGAVTVQGRDVPIVLDEKYGSVAKYQAFLENAHCWQLVMYADLASQNDPGIPVDAIGYFVLTQGKLFVPAWAAGELAHPRFATHVVQVRSKATTTLTSQVTALAQRVAATTARMHQPGAVLPAHPRAAEHGKGFHDDLQFANGTNPKKAVQWACQYCDYGVLCGKDRVR